MSGDSPKVYPPMVLKRIQKDLASLMKEPVINAAASPSNSDLSFWDAVIRVPITHDKQSHVDLHFNILFPSDYPLSAPSIGFTIDFPYSLGASYVKDDGPLKGKLVLCLDLLGNFDHVHTEWKQNVGSGWSPSYSVSSLLLNLQTILTELDQTLDQKSRDKLVEQTECYYRVNPEKHLLVSTAATAKATKIASALTKEGLQLAKDLNIDNCADKLQKLVDYEASLLARSTEKSLNITSKPMIDTNIVCYTSGVNYTEDVLGYGLSVVRKGRQVNISTPAELLSLGAYESGVRVSTNKQSFTYFLPAFINKNHAEQSAKWKATLRNTIVKIGKEVYNNPEEELAKSVYEIFSRLINTLVLEMMKQPDMYEIYFGDSARLNKSPSIAYFEAVCSFWRTFYWISESSLLPGLKPNASMMITKFIDSEDQRLKGACSDVGAMLAAFTVFQRSVSGNSAFVDSYLDEVFLRCVMWWNKSIGKARGVTSQEVFAATKVSRDITLFQLMFLKHVIGDDPQITAEQLDETNGKAPQVLEKFQQALKKSQQNVVTWRSFLEMTGCTETLLMGITKDEEQWVQTCVTRAKARGKSYGF